MSRAVIDQSGFKVTTIGLVIALLLGLSLKAQISSQKIQTLLTEATARLDKDFLIDYQSAEVLLSKWGLPLPYLQISQIRMSPKKASCQDSQIYIEKLILPLSPWALLTTQALVKEISATTVELRVADLNNCMGEKHNNSEKSGAELKLDAPIPANHPIPLKVQSLIAVAAAPSPENIFQIKTAGLLQKLKIEQLKIIYKKHPTQPLNLRQVQVDFSYSGNQVERVQINSQFYALKDPQSDLMFFKGELNLQILARESHRIEAEARLRGRLLDGEIEVYGNYATLEQIMKVDFSVVNVALKPLAQLNMFESSWLNYPVAMDFKGFGKIQTKGADVSFLKLKDVRIYGERTHINVPEIDLKNERGILEINPFEAEIKRLDLNKLGNLSQIKSLSQSIENFGEINGLLIFKDLNHISVEGDWSGLEFIFSNRGRREIQRIESLHLLAKLNSELVTLKLGEFQLNEISIPGHAELSFNQKTSGLQAEASLEGPLLNERIWNLLLQTPQNPRVKLQWNYRKGSEERHQINLQVDEIKSYGLKVEKTEINILQSSQNGVSTSLALSAKANSLAIESESLQLKGLSQIFNSRSYFKEKNYISDPVHLNLKGMDWKNMTYDFEARLKATTDLKSNHTVKGRGEWKEDESAEGVLSIQNLNQLQKFEIIKTESGGSSNFVIKPL